MLDFSYYNPTRLIFGRGAETKVAASFRPFAGDAGRLRRRQCHSIRLD